LWLPLQLVLQRDRRAASTPRTRDAVAAFARPGARVPAPRRPGLAGILLRPASAGADRARTASRAAASGAHPDRRQALAVAQSPEARVPETMAADDRSRARAALGRLRRRLAR